MLRLLPPQGLQAVRRCCLALRAFAETEDFWEFHCMARHWRLKTCGPGAGAATWRALFAAFSRMTPEERWEAEWKGGGFAGIEPSEYFAASPVPRRNRSREVVFSVGQVIVNRSGRYRGVVAGWDEITKVPPDWPSLKRSRQPWLSKPHYSILVHGGVCTYIVDDNSELERVPAEVDNPAIGALFGHFNGQVYVPRPALLALYPEDDALGPLLRRRLCSRCGEAAAGGGARTCASCGLAWYCSAECQLEARLVHQRHCSPGALLAA